MTSLINSSAEVDCVLSFLKNFVIVCDFCRVYSEKQKQIRVSQWDLFCAVQIFNCEFSFLRIYTKHDINFAVV